MSEVIQEVQKRTQDMVQITLHRHASIQEAATNANFAINQLVGPTDINCIDTLSNLLDDTQDMEKLKQFSKQMLNTLVKLYSAEGNMKIVDHLQQRAVETEVHKTIKELVLKASNRKFQPKQFKTAQPGTMNVFDKEQTKQIRKQIYSKGGGNSNRSSVSRKRGGQQPSYPSNFSPRRGGQRRGPPRGRGKPSRQTQYN